MVTKERLKRVISLVNLIKIKRFITLKRTDPGIESKYSRLADSLANYVKFHPSEELEGSTFNHFSMTPQRARTLLKAHQKGNLETAFNETADLLIKDSKDVRTAITKFFEHGKYEEFL